MEVRANNKIPAGEYGFLRRETLDAPWKVFYQDKELATDLSGLDLHILGRLEYRLLGLENGNARIIRFSDLHRHSDASLMDGMTKVPTMVKQTEYSGALTDHGNMYSFLEYYQAMNKAGKKPILGFEGYMVDLNGNLTNNHIIFLAKNNQGYKNLLKLTSESYDHFYERPHVTWEMLEEYHEGIICLSACVGGNIPKALLAGNRADAEALIKRYVAIFGPNDFYIEIQNHGIHKEDIVRPQLVSLAKQFGLRYVATTDSHYPTPEDRDAHQIILCLRGQTTLDDPNKMTYDGEGYYLHTSEQMERRFSDYPEALDASLDIADQCNVAVPIGDINLPKYDYPAPFSNADEYMKHIASEGFKRRFEGTPHITDPVYQQRFDYEIKMIQKMGFSAYFVIVWDFINYARQQNIPVGPGRGSAAGSIVAYCMGITDIDPIRYKLLFERFLNPERVSMPDIDTDIAHTGRPKVIQYMVDKYGKENVCRIVTFGTFAARQVIKDVARVLGFPVSFGTKLSGLIKDPKLYPTISDALEKLPEFADLYANDKDAKRVIDLAMKIEGNKRHTSLHACGLVCAPSQVSDYLPTAMITDKETGEKALSSQVTMAEVETLSLIKMDLLGLKNLSVIQDAIDFSVENYGQEQVRTLIPSTGELIRFQDIPINDRATYNMLKSGDTGGVFQLESEGMTKLIKEMLYDVDKLSDEELGNVAFERLIAAVALYRPGPMDYIPQYLEGLRDPRSIHYDTPEEKDILSSTYGILCYQEQLMQLAQVLAGFSLGQADVIRKGAAKKKQKILDGEKVHFIHGNDAEVEEAAQKGKTINRIAGCVKMGIPEDVAEEIWSKMTKFGNYAFNRSHAACYAWIGYITAYLKCHYPAEFYAGMLNAFIRDSKKEKAYLQQANECGLRLLPPDIQKSGCLFTPLNTKEILFGLQGISGMNKSAADIVADRTAHGTFADLQDLCERMSQSGNKIGSETIEGLVYSGALSAFSSNKNGLLAHYERIKTSLAYSEKQVPGQFSLFADAEEAKIPEVPNVPSMSEAEEMEREYAALGMYVTRHPMDRYEADAKNWHGYLPAEKISISTCGTEGKVKTVGLIKNVRKFRTKSFKEMASFDLETRYASVPCVVFPNDFEKVSTNIIEDMVACVIGKVSADNRDEEAAQISVSQIVDPEIEFGTKTTILSIPIQNEAQQKYCLEEFKKHPGTRSVEFVVTKNGEEHHFPRKKTRVTSNPQFEKDILRAIRAIS